MAFGAPGSAAAGGGGSRAFRDRADAGRRLAEHLEAYGSRDDVLVLGLPRGGVPVAAEVARSLHAPLDVYVVRKLGVPGDEELAMGAIATGGVIVLNDRVVSDLRLSEQTIAAVAAAELEELRRREEAYRGGRPPVAVEGRIVLLVDDGLATGATMRAAVRAVRLRSPARVVVAVPVAAEETWSVLRSEADDVVCPLRPAGFRSVGGWYDDFSATGDDEVRALLAAAELTDPALHNDPM